MFGLMILLAVAAPDPGPRRIAVKNSPTTWIKAGDLNKVGEPWAGRTLMISLKVDEKGRADGCEILQSSGSIAIDAIACAAATRRARFVPALDDQGQPRRSSFNQRIILN